MPDCSASVLAHGVVYGVDLVGEKGNYRYELISSNAGLGQGAFVIGIIEAYAIPGELIGRENRYVLAAALFCVVAAGTVLLIQRLALLPVAQVLIAHGLAHLSRKTVSNQIAARGARCCDE